MLTIEPITTHLGLPAGRIQVTVQGQSYEGEAEIYSGFPFPAHVTRIEDRESVDDILWRVQGKGKFRWGYDVYGLTGLAGRSQGILTLPEVLPAVLWRCG